MEETEEVNVINDFSALIKSWEDEHAQSNYNPVPTLTKLAEIVEVETENYLKMDPDPFDERHPSRSDPDCKLGQILKIVFRKDNFMSKLLNDYLRETFFSRNNITDRDIDELNIAACRLLLDLMPGLETSVVFQDMESLIHRLIKWATNSVEPLQSYATGVLAAAMDMAEIAAKFREENSRLVPLLLQRLKRLKNSSEFAKNIISNNSRPFAHFSSMKSPPYRGDGIIKLNTGNKLSTNEDGDNEPENTLNISSRTSEGTPSPYKRKKTAENSFSSPQQTSEVEPQRRKRIRTENDTNNLPSPNSVSPVSRKITFNETSNSSWAELETFMIGNVQMFPPTIATRQILILRYLTPIGEYQEFLSHAFHENIALDLILTYVNVRHTKEARLSFEALKYLAALLCHKKFSIEFLQRRGLEALLDVPRPSIAATGVSICLYYLGYCEEAMERVCVFPKQIITKLVKYALWLLECSHDSGKCQAIMFFNLTFQFRVILDEFDAQDGLRKLHNVISTLPILQADRNAAVLNEDQECAARQIVRHVCLAYRRYLEAHLHSKAEQLRRSGLNNADRSSICLEPSIPPYKACKSSPEEVQDNIELLLHNLPFKAHWAPVDQLLKHGDITLLLKIIAFAYEWNYGGRGETVRSALEVLAIICVFPKVLSLLCEKVDLPEERLTVGFSIIIGAAEGDIVRDSEVEKAALRVLVNSVCAPISRPGCCGSTSKQFHQSSPNKKMKYKSSEELIQKVWDCVRSNSGILVLIQLMNCKTPITDADSIRTLACKGLAGLARCETVKQIVSKLPLFASGELQSLMRDPILQEKRQEHVAFQKFAMELLVRLSGKTKYGNNDMEVTLANIHRIHKANIVAQTKIQFNDRQLLQLIHQHLVGKGYTDTAALLVKEGNLCNSITSVSSAQHPTKFRYTNNLTPVRTRLSFSSANTRALLPSTSSATLPPLDNNILSASPSILNGNTPIKLKKKTSQNTNNNIISSPTTTTTATTPQISRLQKQISGEPTSAVLRTPGYIQEDYSFSCQDQPRVSLDSIITEYLTNQHALCKNPMATCPQFNLFAPHKCPDPKPKLVTINNFAMRHARRQLGFESKSLDLRFVHSRFCPVQTIRHANNDGFFTCAKFLPGRNTIVVGDSSGDIHFFDKFSGNEERSFGAHDNYVVNIEPNRTGEFLLSSSTWRGPLSALWGIGQLELKLSFNHDDYVEFSKLSQDKIIGTKNETATIYDANTGQVIMKLAPRLSNLYTKNKATFSWNDELVLTDGVLFDVNSGKVINRLDKLNQTQNGVFHPNGLEIISNTEIWDIRTDTKSLHLLKTVPVLNQCSIMFSPINSVLYGISMAQETDDGDSIFDSSFKTVNSSNYSSIATIEVKRHIYDLAVNAYDTQIGLVENQGFFNSVQESVVRLYDVGRQRDDEDEHEEEDDDEDIDNSDDDASDEVDRVIINLARLDNLEDNNDNNDADNNRDNQLSDSEDSPWTSGSSSSSDSSSTSFLNDMLF